MSKEETKQNNSAYELDDDDLEMVVGGVTTYVDENNQLVKKASHSCVAYIKS